MTSESASARWARIIVEQRNSELSIAEFCRRHELSAPSFFAWRRRLGAGRPGPAFVEVKVEGVERPEQMPASPVPLEFQPGGQFRGASWCREASTGGRCRNCWKPWRLGHDDAAQPG